MGAARPRGIGSRRRRQKPSSAHKSSSHDREKERRKHKEKSGEGGAHFLGMNAFGKLFGKMGGGGSTRIVQTTVKPGKAGTTMYMTHTHGKIKPVWAA